MTAPINQPKSKGLGNTVFEFPGGGKKGKTPPPQDPPQPAPAKLDLLRHIPDCAFKRYVLDVAKMTRIPANTSLMVGLGIVSTVTARCFVVTYEERGHQPLGMYVLAEHDSGTGKSWMLGTYQSPVFASVKALVSDWQSRKKAADAAKEDFNDPFPNFAYDTDSSPEGLDETLESTRGYFALASAEQGLANSISGAAYGGEGRKSNKDLWLKGYNGEYHSSKRSKRNGYRGEVVGAVVNIAQPGLVQTILTHGDNTGAAERCIMLSEPSLLGHRKHGRDHRHYPGEGDQGHYNRIMQGLTAQACQNLPIDQLPGFRLSRDDWDKVYSLQNDLEPHLAGGGKYSTQTLKSMVSKADLQVMKIAANLAILDDCPPGLIPSHWVEAAIGIVRDLLDYVYRLLVEMGVIGTNAFEESVIAFLSDKAKTHTTRAFQTAKSTVKPWSELQKGTSGQVMRDTFTGLEAKGIIWKNPENGEYRLIA